MVGWPCSGCHQVQRRRANNCISMRFVISVTWIHFCSLTFFRLPLSKIDWWCSLNSPTAHYPVCAGFCLLIYARAYRVSDSNTYDTGVLMTRKWLSRRFIPNSARDLVGTKPAAIYSIQTCGGLDMRIVCVRKHIIVFGYLHIGQTITVSVMSYTISRSM